MNPSSRLELCSPLSPLPPGTLQWPRQTGKCSVLPRLSPPSGPVGIAVSDSILRGPSLLFSSGFAPPLPRTPPQCHMTPLSTQRGWAHSLENPYSLNGPAMISKHCFQKSKLGPSITDYQDLALAHLCSLHCLLPSPSHRSECSGHSEWVFTPCLILFPMKSFHSLSTY